MNRNSCSPSVRRPAFRPSGLPAFLRPMKSHLLSRSALRSLNLEGEEKKRDSCSPSSRKQQTACVRPSGLPAFRPPGLPSPEEISFTEYIVPACLSVEEEEKESTLSWEWGGLLTEEDPVPRVNFWPTHT